MSARPLPSGFTLTLLPAEPSPSHAEARQFCLETIREFYGFGYRPDWHRDLDALLLPSQDNHYSPHHGGAFWLVRDASGEMVATTGIRHLAWKPNLIRMFPDRYGSGADTASLWRLYVRRDQRGQGLGRWLTALCEDEATRLGYRSMYLHASSDASATLAFWQAVGYRQIGVCETSTHFDKPLQSMGAAAEEEA